MAKKIIWSNIFILAAALLQSTIFLRISRYLSAVPDLALCILVFSAYTNGIMTGQLTGFCSGFILDFLSAAPLGLNALVRTLIGALTGIMKGTFVLDVVFLPMVLCAAATIAKALVFFLLNWLLGETIPRYSFFELTFWVELGLNTFFAPFLFGLLKLAEPLITGRRRNS